MKGALCRGRDDRLDGPPADVAHRAEAEADPRSPTTVNLKPDSFTSGGSTSRPSSRASLMYWTTLSVLPISDDSSAAMNSAG